MFRGWRGLIMIVIVAIIAVMVYAAVRDDAMYSSKEEEIVTTHSYDMNKGKIKET